MGLEQQKLAAKQQKDAVDAQIAMEKIQTDKMVDMAELSLEEAELQAKTSIEQDKLEAEGYKYAMDQLKGE